MKQISETYSPLHNKNVYLVNEDGHLFRAYLFIYLLGTPSSTQGLFLILPDTLLSTLHISPIKLILIDDISALSEK